MKSEEIANLERAVRGVHNGQVMEEWRLHDLVDSLRPLLAPSASDQEVTELKRELSSQLSITVDRGVAIQAPEIKPWLAGRKHQLEWPRWEAYNALLASQGRPPAVVRSMDETTDRILDLMGDPADTGDWQRRGLVIGDVQSGKTSTYLGLLNKAADTGFKLIILLGGHTESLRQQTQERADEGFIGIDTRVSSQSKGYNRRPIGVGTFNKKLPTPTCLTTRRVDFSRRNNEGSAVQFNPTDSAPCVMVVKKNKKVLEAVNAWLAQQHSADAKIQAPLLVLDDEADYASVNTNKEDTSPTAINAEIQRLLDHSSQGMYIAFTATPFANIFIDPDYPRDLFPKDFIYALEAPSNYFGAVRTFLPESLGKTDPTVEIDDADTCFPPKHRASWTVPRLPESLKDAIRAFLLTNALRDLRGDTTPVNRSMLINTSTFKAVQRQVGELTDSFLSAQIRAIQLHADDPATCDSDPVLAELRRVYSTHFASTPVDWNTLRSVLSAAVRDIKVEVFNSDNDKKLDENGEPWQMPPRLIAVGGNVLSRGLTLEGLTISYFYRQVRAADTLLQMARWFGYRTGYDDLCRVWIEPSAADDFRYIADAVQELRLELHYMNTAQLTPADFGLKIRKHPGSLLVTARNKSRAAENETATISLLGRRIESTRLSTDTNQSIGNGQALSSLLTRLCAGEPQDLAGRQPLVWRAKSNEYVAEFLDSFHAHESDRLFSGNALANYVKTARRGPLQSWDIALFQGDGPSQQFGPLSPHLVERTVTKSAEGAILVSGRSARLAGSTDVRRLIEDTAELDRVTEHFSKTRADAGQSPTKTVPETLFYRALARPLLMVYPLQPKSETVDLEGLSPLVGVKICLPGDADSRGRGVSGDVTYLVNKVALRGWGVDLTLDDGSDEIDE